MRLTVVCWALLSIIALPIIGCATSTQVAISRQVNMVAAIKSNHTQQTRRLSTEGLVKAIVKDNSAIAEFSSRENLYWTRLSLLLEAGKSHGKTVCDLAETYRASDTGIYSVHLEGVAESGSVPAKAIESELEILIEVRSSLNSRVLVQLNKKLRPKIYYLEGQQRFWLSLADEVEPVTIKMEKDDQYLVHTRLALTAGTKSRLSNEQVSIGGKFRLILEPFDKVKEREKLARSLCLELIGLWTREDSNLAVNPQLHDAARSLARLFFIEGVRYVDINVPEHIRFACFEHARILREWYETRMILDPNLARWFRMTTVRRNTPFIWQSSNMVTPSVDDPPDKWMDDGTGIVLEPKPAGAGEFYGRYISAREFYVGLRPKIQETAKILLLNSKHNSYTKLSEK